jgi:methyl halide transferase
MSDDPPIDWESRYRDGATGWERPGLNPAFLSWRENGVLTPCRILVPGGGRSNEPLAMAESGFDVTVVDLAESAVAAQRGRLERLHVKARVAQADLLRWDASSPFDSVYDQACLCALRPAQWPAYAARVRTWLRPGGRLFILFMQTHSAGGPPFHCDLATMQRLFPPGQWRWPERLESPIPQSPGRDEQPVVLERL